MLYMPKYRYIVVSTELGELIVYKWDPAGASIVTEFKGIERAIRTLTRHTARINQFITASLDCTIRIWCLEKFVCQYVLHIPQAIKNIKMLDGSLQFVICERD